MNKVATKLTANSLAKGILLGALFGTSLSFGTSCVGTDQRTELERELELARAQQAKRDPAECYPGHREPCYSGPSGTAGRGICKEGLRVCNDQGQWQSCDGEQKPEPAELCNGVDDNCNGIVDDGFKREGTKCFAGLGECRSEGTYSCSEDGKKSECNAARIEPSAELCDGKDNDCDGEVDEGDVQGTGQACSTGKPGVCSTGHKSCVAGEILCMSDRQPSAEICNKIDDDCDGEVDNNCMSEEDAKKAGIIK